MTKEETDKLWRGGYAAKFMSLVGGEANAPASLLLTEAGLVGWRRIAVLIEAMQLLEEEE